MIRVVSLVCLLVSFAGVPVLADDKVGENPYYPLKVGTTWTYRFADKKLTQKVTKHEKQGDQMCARVETIVDGNTVSAEHIAVTKDGLARLSFNGVTPEKPVVFLKLDAKKGDSWSVDTKAGTETIKGKFTRGEDDVEVPGHKGKAITSKGDFEINGQAMTFGYWFAEKKGIVKLQMSGGGQNIVMELESFEEGK